MKEISLRSITMARFGSFVEQQTVQFDGAPGLKYLSGRNEVEPRLGANGAGKSTLWNALFWCLYGTSIEGDKASALVSWNAEKPVVEAILDVSGDAVCITRQGSPERIEVRLPDRAINATQADVDQVLGLSKARFVQCVLFGQGGARFLDLDMAARGKLLDETLDLSLWGVASGKAEARAKELRVRLGWHQQNRAYEEGTLNGLPEPDSIMAAMREWQDAEDAKTDAMLAEIDASETTAKTLDQLRQDIYNELQGLATIDESEYDALSFALREQLSAEYEIQDKIKSQEGHIGFFAKNHAFCPTCRQSLKAAYVSTTVKGRMNKIDELKKQLNVCQTKLRDTQRKIDAARAQESQYKAARAECQQRFNHCAIEVRAHNTAYQRLLDEVERITAKPPRNPYAEDLERLEAKRKETADKIAEHKQAIHALEGEAQSYEFWQKGFKRLRLFIIKRILMQWEIDTANAASLLGIGNWQIKFMTETVTRSDTFRHGVQIHILPPGGEHATTGSGGERQRVRLAINMGLSTLIQREAGVRYTFEVWDEPSDALSDEGIEDLLDCLRYRANITGKEIWLTDHRTLSYQFDATWIAVKTTNGSHIEQDASNDD